VLVELVTTRRNKNKRNGLSCGCWCDDHCIRLLTHSLRIVRGLFLFKPCLLVQLPSLAITFALDVLALMGGALALGRKQIVFAVFGASVLIAASATSTSVMIEWLIERVNFSMSVLGILYAFINAAALILSILSLVFLARSKPEFT
jgi:hypothetical protein